MQAPLLIKNVQDAIKFLQGTLQYQTAAAAHRWPMATDYHERVRITNDIRIHSEKNKAIAAQLLLERFPSEPFPVFDYRLRNMCVLTNGYYEKVRGIIYRLRNSANFVAKTDSEILLELESTLPGGSVMNFVFDHLLDVMLVDPNALVDLRYPAYPKIHYTGETYYRHIYGNRKVYLILIDYELDDQWAMRTRVDYDYIEIEAGGVTVTRIRLDVKSGKYVIYDMSRMPGLQNCFFEMPGISNGIYSMAKKSVLQGMVEGFNKSLVQLSEYDACLKQHVFPEKYRYIVDSCTRCQGLGQIEIANAIGGGNTIATCNVCNGTGTPATGPFSETLIDLKKMGTMLEKMPNPPSGYVQKDTETVGFVRDSWQEYLNEGLAAVSMDFLGKTGLNQSGYAKEMDRAEFTIFLTSVAQKISEMCRNTYAALIEKAVAYQYLGDNLMDEYRALTDSFKKTLSFEIPAKFINLYAEDAANEIVELRNAQVSHVIIKEKERNLVENDRRLDYIIDIDPLYGYSFDQKMQMKDAGMVSEIDLYISLNIDRIISEMGLEDGWFYSRTNFKKIKEMVKAAAQTHLEEIKKEQPVEPVEPEKQEETEDPEDPEEQELMF